MSKSNSFVKYLKNINNSINILLEENLNKLNFNNLKNLLFNNKLILTFVALLVLFISYLLMPTFYKTSEVSRELKSQLRNKLDLNFKFSEKLNYNFFPSPHFRISDSFILKDNKEISKINDLKIYISLENLFSLKKTKIKNIVIEKANFNLNNSNYNFFLKLLDNNFLNSDLTIKNSNIFLKNVEEEVLFINKIYKMKYYYDQKELKNILYSENEIFNVIYSIEVFKNENKKKIFSKINLNSLKMKIENDLFFENEIKVGKSNIIFNKSKSTLNYKINKNSLTFDYFDKLDNPNFFYKGKLNFNPFYSSFNGKTEKLNLSYFFYPNSFFIQLLKTETLNSKNLDFNLNIVSKNILQSSDFLDIILNSKIQEGLFDIDNTTLKWKDFVSFELLDSLIYVKDGEVLMDGKLNIDIKKFEEIYKFLLTPKNNRKKIQKIELNFSYNIDQKIINMSNIIIDNKFNDKINKIMSSVILKENNLQNRILLKKLLNEAIKNYSG